MRKNFAQILQENRIDIKNEYTKLYSFLYDDRIPDSSGRIMISVYRIISRCFHNMWFRGTALSLEEFDKQNGFYFEKEPQNFDIEYLVSFCEYFYNILLGYKGCTRVINEINTQIIIDQIRRVIDAIGYMESKKDGFIIFVEKSPAAIAVAEIVDDDLSYKVIAYNHHSLMGNLPEKKNILLKFAEKLEPKRKQIETFNKNLSDDLFFCFNNLNIRHNNTDKWGSDYREPVAKMSNDKLEKWYDDVYQMSLLAFLCLEQKDIQNNIKALKQSIKPTKTE